jgi:hypothetical protein
LAHKIIVVFNVPLYTHLTIFFHNYLTYLRFIGSFWGIPNGSITSYDLDHGSWQLCFIWQIAWRWGILLLILCSLTVGNFILIYLLYCLLVGFNPGEGKLKKIELKTLFLVIFFWNGVLLQLSFSFLIILFIILFFLLVIKNFSN